MKKPRCTRCGRTLSDPVSIARGMGPQCAGRGGGGGRRVKSHARRGSGRSYAAAGHGRGQLSLFANGTAPPRQETRLEKRVRLQALKRERRAFFENQEPFQCGVNPRTREPVVYAPTPEGGWINSAGQTTTHASLEKYLKTYGWI